MIQATEVAELIRSVGIDADGTDFYDDDLHIIPAINSAMKWLCSVATLGISQNKISEEAFVENIVCQIFQTNALSRILIDSDIFGILGVYPTPTCLPDSDPDLTGNEYDSKELKKHFVSAEYSCKRLTLEEWSFHKGNPFKAGNTFQSCEELIEYAYLSPLDYGQYTDNVAGSYIEIRPALNRKLVAIKYIETPTEITDLTDNLPIRYQLKNILAMRALNLLTYKQGDNTNVYGVSAADVNSILKALS